MKRLDLVVAPAVGLVMVSATLINGVAGPGGYALLAAAAVALHWHRVAPQQVLVVTTGCALLYALFVEPELTAGLPALISLASTVRHGHRRLSQVAALALILAMIAAYLLAGQDPLAAVKGGILVTGWFVAAVAMGVALQQADQRAQEAEHNREEAALRRAGEERLRIARDLHDSLTHTISVIKVQAGVAAHLAAKRGEQVPPALAAIQEASGEAMRELRETLEVLRDESVSLARLPELAERLRAAGLPLDLRIEGDPGALPAEVDQAAYRIVQEALTNVARHAPGARAEVTLAYGRRAVTVTVADDGAGTAPAVPGKGLTGMRERAEALGGKLQAGPGERGFLVRAELPVPSRMRQPA
ncbi:sensor histidine kinase [Nonomuraea sp. NPDC050310]|uniref:sensor histidine kinase n=1 Tax=Nonomuraea sp. NPDC050310 TaxID=3154935 RepID=UPI0033D6B0C8